LKWNAAGAALIAAHFPALKRLFAAAKGQARDGRGRTADDG
jgi:hypothetical protein